jgi:hypothetical protein
MQLAGTIVRPGSPSGPARPRAHNRDGWGVGLTIVTALANLPLMLPEEEAYLALFHGARRVAADCDGEAPQRECAPLGPSAAYCTERWRSTLRAISMCLQPVSRAANKISGRIDQLRGHAGRRQPHHLPPNSDWKGKNVGGRR